MPDPDSPPEEPPPSGAAPEPATAPHTSVAAEKSIYGSYFWAMYAANFVIVAANATTFKFAEFVAFLGGNETQTGDTVTAGLIGAVLIRYLFAHELDRFGYRTVWMVGGVSALLGVVLMATSGGIGAQLLLARLCFSTGLAIVFACSNAHIQTRVPDNRRTEMIAMIGSSGFLGLMTGVKLADMIFLATENSPLRYHVLFGTSAALALTHVFIATFVTRAEKKPERQRTVRMGLVLLTKYWPGACLLPGVMMGAGFACTSTFLSRFATERGFAEFTPFFFGYAITAFGTRMISRTWPARFGRRLLILAGCVSQAIGFGLFVVLSEAGLMTQQWMLALPAIGVGFGHAVLFPSVVSIGAGRFPARYRGTGTLLTMGIFDIGFLISAPLQGRLADAFGFLTVFLSVAAGFVIAGVLYGILSHGEFDGDLDPEFAANAAKRREARPRFWQTAVAFTRRVGH